MNPEAGTEDFFWGEMTEDQEKELFRKMVEGYDEAIMRAKFEPDKVGEENQ